MKSRALRTVLSLNICCLMVLGVRSQAHAYDYGYATNIKEYTRKITLKQGELRGVVVESRNRALPPIEQYLGIPYAAAPTGELRFMPPGSARIWFGTKIADSFGHVCTQKFPDKEGMAPERAEYFAKLSRHLILNQSEDCLYLNIYAPISEEGSSNKYPVMVFIHGESFEWNSGNHYDGSVLAAYGKVIVVTINYRLGVFGFLKTGLEENASSNFGLIDQVAALLWVQENIAAFGGNPDSVTLFGHGTGAVCANLLMLSPMVVRDRNKLLFHRAILMGGSALSDWALAGKPLPITYQLAGALNCPSNADEMAACLRRKKSSEIQEFTATSPDFVTKFGPIVDGHIIPNDPLHLMTSYGELFKRFELMYGVTEVESAHLFGPVSLIHGILEKERDQELKKYLYTKCELRPDLCLAHTLAAYVDEYEYPMDDQSYSTFSGQTLDKAKSARDQLLQILSDARTVAPMTKMAKLHSAVNPESYFYVFGHTTFAKEHIRNKSIHGDELPYIFGVPLDGPKFHFTDHYTAHERLFSEVIMTYFTNFAYSGNPNVPRRGDFFNLNPKDWHQFEVDWPEYDATNQPYLYLAVPPEVRFHYRSREIRFWNDNLPELLRNPVNTYKTSQEPFFKSGLPTSRPKSIPPWIFPRPTQKSQYDKFENFYQFPIKPTEVYGKLKYKSEVPSANDDEEQRNLEFGTIITAETSNDIKSGSTLSMILLIGVALVLTNVIVFAVLYYKCIRLRNKEAQRQEDCQAAVLDSVDGKFANPSPFTGCNIIKFLGNSSKNGEMYEAVKISEDGGSNIRFKLNRQMSSSTIDPHTKVRDWIAQEIAQKCSPDFFKRHNIAIKDANNIIKEVAQRNTSFSQSPTRPVSPECNPELDEPCKSSTCGSRQKNKTKKVSVAVDATPSGRGSSVLRQQPIELTKSLDYQHLETPKEIPLRRSFTTDDVQAISSTNTLRRSSTSINLKFPKFDFLQEEKPVTLKIDHSHSKSEPVQDIYKSPEVRGGAARKFETFKSVDGDVNVTSRDDNLPSPQPLSAEEQLRTIKRRNFPKVLPDLPSDRRNKRMSMPVTNFPNSFEEETFSSSPTLSQSKSNSRLPPAPPPRTTSTLSRSYSNHSTYPFAVMLAEEPPMPTEPELTYNNLYIGPLLPSKQHDPYRQNMHKIYGSLKPAKPARADVEERKEPNTIVTTDSENPIKRIEPKVIIKPSISKKVAENNRGGARVIARNSNDETLVATMALTKINEENSDIANLDNATKSTESLEKISERLSSESPSGVVEDKKESSSSESTPSEESDTGTVIKVE